ncbi:MAG: ROK family protein [Planctomycetota bacterium]
MATRYSIGIDLGGTNIKGGVCDAAGAVLAKASVATEAERGVDHVIGRMAALVTDLLRSSGLACERIVAVGVGAPGPMSHKGGIIHHAPNLPGWVNIPLRERFARICGFPVVLENDANAAAFGEFTAGAGRDVRNMVMLTLGTGVGGGVVLDGRLWRGAFDNAGEIGHTIIVPDGRPCPCGQRGCMERYASALAVAERLREAIEAGEDLAMGSASRLRPRVVAGEVLDARDVEQARAAGDLLATRIWDETCYYLALSAVNIQHMLNPELVVFAGGLINAGAALLEPVQAHFARQSWKIAPDQPRIAFATLGTDAGTIGAAVLAFEEHGAETGT